MGANSQWGEAGINPPKPLHGTNNKQERTWVASVYDRAKLTEKHYRPEDSANEKDDLREEARELRLFAKEFGQGVRQQRVGDKTKEKAGTLPLVLRMIRRVRKWKWCWHSRRAAIDSQLVYTVGNEDNDPPRCILDIALNGGSGWWEVFPKSNREATPEKLG